MVSKSMKIITLLITLFLSLFNVLTSKLNTLILSNINLGVAKMKILYTLLCTTQNISKINYLILNQFEVVYYFTRWQISGKK